MELIDIGFGNMVSAERIIAVLNPDSAPVKRIMSDAKERGTLVDATYGRKTVMVILADSGHVILSGVAIDDNIVKTVLKGERE